MRLFAGMFGRTVATGLVVAVSGVGCGPIVVVRSEEDLKSFPDGGVLVAGGGVPSAQRDLMHRLATRPAVVVRMSSSAAPVP